MCSILNKYSKTAKKINRKPIQITSIAQSKLTIRRIKSKFSICFCNHLHILYTQSLRPIHTSPAPAYWYSVKYGFVWIKLILILPANMCRVRVYCEHNKKEYEYKFEYCMYCSVFFYIIMYLCTSIVFFYKTYVYCRLNNYVCRVWRRRAGAGEVWIIALTLLAILHPEHCSIRINFALVYQTILFTILLF